MANEVPKKGEPLLFLDVESLPAEEGHPIWELLKPNIRTPENVSEETPEERSVRVEKLRENSALHGVLGRAWMIGLALGGGDVEVLKSDGSVEGEKPLLEAFYERIRELDRPWLIGHNVEGYDLPFLKVRALANDLPGLARILGGPSHLKPWERRVIDTSSLFPRTGADKSAWRQGLVGLGKLDTICVALGVPRQSGVMGPDVYRAYLEGDFDGVENHLREDIEQLRAVFRKLWPIY